MEIIEKISEIVKVLEKNEIKVGRIVVFLLYSMATVACVLYYIDSVHASGMFWLVIFYVCSLYLFITMPSIFIWSIVCLYCEIKSRLDSRRQRIMIGKMKT
jgi:hypothetical protein